MTPTPTEIKTARQAAGLTQAQAAQLVGVLLRSWQRWESGERKISATAWELFQLKTENNMNTEKFVKTLDDDRGTGHSFFDPFTKDGADPDDHLQDMIEIALETHGDERGENNTMTGWALTNRKLLKKFREDEDFRVAATAAVKERAVQLIDQAKSE